METFDKFSVSYVPVTQHFNATHSVEHVTPTLLLSFSHFEREFNSEPRSIKAIAVGEPWNGRGFCDGEAMKVAA
jgi:site-specific DNA recombinase